eukprot:9651959-Heterocapsa_arctica.AAC.1
MSVRGEGVQEPGPQHGRSLHGEQWADDESGHRRHRAEGEPAYRHRGRHERPLARRRARRRVLR